MPGPVSSNHLIRIFVFKMSQDMFKTKIMFHQTLEICPIRRAYKSVSQPILLHVLTSAAAFHVILDAEEDEYRPRPEEP